MQQVIIFILLKFSLLSYDLNTVCMIRMQIFFSTFKTDWRISKNFQFHLHRPSMRLPDYCNRRCHERKLKLLRTWSYTQVVIFWINMEKVVFKLENVIPGMNTDHFWCWKSGVFLQSTGSTNLRTLLLIRQKAWNAVSREKSRK